MFHIFLYFPFLYYGILGPVDAEPDSQWRTDGHQYNLQEKLVFGQGGGRSRGHRRVSNIKHSSRQFGEFEGGNYTC